MKQNSQVALTSDGFKVPAGECGRVLAVFADKTSAEVQFDSGVKLVVPLADLDEFDEIETLPTTENTPKQGQGEVDMDAVIEMMITVAADLPALAAASGSIERRIAGLKAQIAKLQEEKREVAKLMPHIRSVAKRVARMKLSDAAKIAEVKAACGKYARK